MKVGHLAAWILSITCCIFFLARPSSNCKFSSIWPPWAIARYSRPFFSFWRVRSLRSRTVTSTGRFGGGPCIYFTSRGRSSSPLTRMGVVFSFKGNSMIGTLGRKCWIGSGRDFLKNSMFGLEQG